jgi:AcrR family transcriptional regulator
MPRPKRDPEVMKVRILNAAENLLLEHGPSAVTLRKIAKEIGVSHPAILYYFEGLPAIIEALQQRASRTVRAALIQQLSDVSQNDVNASVHKAIDALTEPKTGALIAWLIAEGRTPFPPAEEQGLKQVVDHLVQATNHPRARLEEAVELVVIASIGDALVGSAVRERLASSELHNPWPERFMTLVTKQLRN